MPDARAVWDRVHAEQRERWHAHVADHLPDRLLDQLSTGPVEVPAD